MSKLDGNRIRPTVAATKTANAAHKSVAGMCFRCRHGAFAGKTVEADLSSLIDNVYKDFRALQALGYPSLTSWK